MWAATSWNRSQNGASVGKSDQPTPSNQSIPYSGVVKNTSSMVPAQNEGRE